MPQSAAELNTLIIQKQQVPTIFKVLNWLMMDWLYLLEGFAIPTTVNAVSTTDLLQAK